MRKKKKISKEEQELRKEIEEGRVIRGSKSVIKSLKKGLLSKVYLANNCPSSIKEDIEYYARLGKVPLIFLEMNNEELGVFCKKHFFISVLGVKKK